MPGAKKIKTLYCVPNLFSARHLQIKHFDTNNHKRVISNYVFCAWRTPGVRLLCAGCVPGLAQIAICDSARCLKTGG
jgi:hypothetical protein